MCPEEGRPDQGVRLRLILGVPRAVFCAGGTISRSRQRCCHILPYAWCFPVHRGILFVCSFWFLFPEPHRSRPDAYEVRPRRGFHARVPNGEGRRAGRLSCARRLRSSLPRSTSVWVLRPFSIRVVCFSFFSFLCCKSSLSVLDIKPLLDDLICKCFLSLWGVLWLWGVL